MATNVAELRLGDLFVREGLIDAEQLNTALQDAKENLCLESRFFPT